MCDSLYHYLIRLICAIACMKAIWYTSTQQSYQVYRRCSKQCNSPVIMNRSDIYENEELHKHIHGNARNIKRLFNIISLTASLINSFLKKVRHAIPVADHFTLNSQIFIHFQRRRRHFIQSHSSAQREPDCTDEIREDYMSIDVSVWMYIRISRREYNFQCCKIPGDSDINNIYYTKYRTVSRPMFIRCQL